MKTPKLVGIVNLTEDSFSDGGQYLKPDAAIAHALRLIDDGADIVELGPASSHPDSKPVSDDEQIARLGPVLDRLRETAIPISVDAARPSVQRFAAENGAGILNDIQGFPDQTAYADLVQSGCTLVVMHSVVSGERAGYVDTAPDTIVETICSFLESRVAALQDAGIARNRIVIDPGMGFFLGTNPETSVSALRGTATIRERLGLPIMVCVSRKSFLQKLAGRDAAGSGAATLAAELYATSAGADYIRTHDVGALKDALTVAGVLFD